MAKVKLTAGRIDAFSCPVDKHQVFLWDTDINGLAVRATTGTKAFIYQSRLNGKSLRITIGDISVWRLEEYRHPKTGEIITPGARPEARRLQAIIDQGRDPREVKAEITAADAAKREKSKQEESPALEAWNIYIQSRSSKWSERHRSDHETMSREGGEKITRGRRKGGLDKKGAEYIAPPARFAIEPDYSRCCGRLAGTGGTKTRNPHPSSLIPAGDLH